jgi:type VI secretion system protein ImpL
MDKLRLVFNVVAMANAYERAPWIRAVALGSAIPGSGDRMRAGVARFYNMGLAQGAAGPLTGRPGGLPFHAFMGTVVLPERDIVPLRTRWRDDKVFQFTMLCAALFYVSALVAALVFAMVNAEERRAPTRAVPVPSAAKSASKH